MSFDINEVKRRAGIEDTPDNPFRLAFTQETIDWYQTPSKTTKKQLEINGKSEEELFAKFFREFQNRSKYDNNTSYSIDDPEMKQKYKVWFSDPHNYEAAGGDMW